VESYSGTYDVTEVFVNSTSVWRRTSADTSANTWQSSGAISLSAFAGQSVTVEFRFNTVDSAYNDFLGWAVDNVVVTGEAACP
jgi:hypothetical protein